MLLSLLISELSSAYLSLKKPAEDVPVHYAKPLGPCPSYSTACSWTRSALQAHQGPADKGFQESVSPKHR